MLFWMMMYNDHLDNAVDLYSGEMKACGKPSDCCIFSIFPNVPVLWKDDLDAHS